ncbi:MAG TPA: hypothetical protein VD816_16740 [Ohtaekwangia sp.]|nr:hypothetical protein [Ohtaekwangia sp.]
MEILHRTKTLISVLEFRRLLVDLLEKRPDIYIRYRLLGDMWAKNFMRIILVTSRGVLVNDEIGNKLIALQDLAMVMQFEIEKSFQEFQPHFHYEVHPDPA